MKPVDYRNETYNGLLGRLTGLRERVLDAWRRHGPCTTEQLAEWSDLSILTLRPRTTELYQMGFVIFEGEGIYRAATAEETRAHFARLKSEATTGQVEMSL